MKLGPGLAQKRSFVLRAGPIRITSANATSREQSVGVLCGKRKGRIRFADRVEAHLCWTNLAQLLSARYREQRALERSSHVRI